MEAYKLDLEETLMQIYARRLILSYGRDGSAQLAWRYPFLPVVVKRAIRNRRRSLGKMMLAGDWRLCPSPDAHRHEYFYGGQGRYVCGICQRLDAAQLGMWQQVS